MDQHDIRPRLREFLRVAGWFALLLEIMCPPVGWGGGSEARSERFARLSKRIGDHRSGSFTAASSSDVAVRRICPNRSTISLERPLTVSRNRFFRIAAWYCVNPLGSG